jgi:hypothetical protein
MAYSMKIHFIICEIIGCIAMPVSRPQHAILAPSFSAAAEISLTGGAD